ncbi:MAG: BspA family leucine-rich repeat surface protein [Flammeovirgaceae bacterium]
MSKMLLRFILILFLSIGSVYTYGQFIMTWQTTTDNETIEMPIVGSGYNYDIDWGDGTMNSGITGYTEHTYATAGVYTVKISGDFPRIRFTDSNRNKILSIEQWGDIEWTTMKSAFLDCSNLVINATDAPNLTNVTSLEGMFRGAISFNQSIEHWNTSTIENMYNMFQGATSFNQPLNNWDVSNVQNMRYMFFRATSFNQPLNDWNVSNVTDMLNMFREAESFNGSLNNWNVSNVQNIAGMFYDAISFNQPLNDWNVSNLENMGTLFFGATSFNQPLDQWDVSNVTEMNSMFREASSFDGSLNSWNTSNVRSMRHMFLGATSFNQPIGTWNVSNVQDMYNMFSEATSFDQPIEDWNVSQVTDMGLMFSNAVSFDQPLNNWNVSNVQNMASMFSIATSFNQPLDHWNVSNVQHMGAMFTGAISFNQPIGDWDMSNKQSLERMFYRASSFNQPLDNWNVSHVENMQWMFREATSFNQPLNHWNVSNTTNMKDLLRETNLSVINYDTTLKAWANLSLANGVRLGASGLNYCTAETERQFIINTYNWAIIDDGRLHNFVNIFEAACDSYIAPDDSVYTESTIFDFTIPNSLGCDSTITINLTINNSSTSDIAITACDAYTAPDGQVYTTTGIYTAVIPTVASCDSTITIDLTINNVDTAVSLNGETITATLSNATYQWLDCTNNYAIIPDATNQSFTASENGIYAVEITANGCVDTSACIEITTVGIDYDPIFNEVSIYPNPTKQFFYIDLGSLEKAKVNIYSYDGILIKDNISINHHQNRIELNQPAGVYLIELTAQEGRRTFRILKH